MWRHQLGALALVLLTGCTSQAIPPAPTTTEPIEVEQTTGAVSTASTNPVSTARSTTTPAPAPTQTQALYAYLSRLQQDNAVRVGLVAHRASNLPEGRTIDVIDSSPELELVRIFAPEHGLAGTADAGQPVTDSIEPVTGVPVVSLYGTSREPTTTDLNDLDVVVYDLQDVGVRAYTYIATMGIMMNAADEAGIPFVVVDRANPQGPVIDGPLLVAGLESFISPYPIPTAYGLSSGELARLLVGEDYVDSSAVTVVGPQAPLPEEWVPPSPNLPTVETAWLYPTVVAFEATVLSEGRGTEEPFTRIGGPGVNARAVVASLANRQMLGLDVVATEFTPRAIPGMATSPRYEGQTIPGVRLSTRGPLAEPLRVTVELLDAFMDAAADRGQIINRPELFDRLVGDPAVREALLADTPPADIAAGWAGDVAQFEQRSLAYRN